MNDSQTEAIANADAQTSNAALPTYSELLAFVREVDALDDSVVGLNRIDYARGQAAALLAKVWTA